MTLANPQRRVCFSSAADGRAVRRRDVTRPARSIYERPRRRRSSLMTRSRASGIVSERALALAARARLPAAGEAHVMCLSRPRCGGDVTPVRGVPSPFPSPKPRSSLTATILPTSPPSDVHALLHGPEEVRGAAQVSFRPPEPLACIRHLLFVFPFCNFFQLSTVPRLSGPKRRSHETSPSIAPDSPIAGSAAFARRPPRRRPGPGTSSPSPPASPTRVARLT